MLSAHGGKKEAENYNFGLQSYVKIIPSPADHKLFVYSNETTAYLQTINGEVIFFLDAKFFFR